MDIAPTPPLHQLWANLCIATAEESVVAAYPQLHNKLLKQGLS